ncbi:MAG: hypothetical protein HYZ63_02635 [Candidatus Andersenbacteria bacterium]|nr:hypothetical protein [Candidatus Andersenbacteria bacterium]
MTGLTRKCFSLESFIEFLWKRFSNRGVDGEWILLLLEGQHEGWRPILNEYFEGIGFVQWRIQPSPSSLLYCRPGFKAEQVEVAFEVRGPDLAIRIMAHRTLKRVYKQLQPHSAEWLAAEQRSRSPRSEPLAAL